MDELKQGYRRLGDGLEKCKCCGAMECSNKKCKEMKKGMKHDSEQMDEDGDQD